MNFLKKIRNFLIIFTLFGVLTAGLDYLRMNSGLAPIFNISKFDEKTRIQSYRGLFYQASRKVKVSTNESLVDSSNIEYTVLNQKINVPKQFKKQERDFLIKTDVIKDCTEQSKLYYADLNVKVYTYCLNDIKVEENNKTKELKDLLTKDKNILKNIDYKLAYTGINADKTTLMYEDLYNLSNNGLTMYRCNKQNINDVYFAPAGVSMQQDFCTYKDDDFKFIYEIEEAPAENTEKIEGEDTKEVFYEDETYRYEFDVPTLNRISITTPEIRGKAATSTPLKTILDYKILTLDELAEKGLKFNKIDKKKGQEELQKKALEEAKKQQEASQNQQDNPNNNQNQ